MITTKYPMLPERLCNATSEYGWTPLPRRRQDGVMVRCLPFWMPLMPRAKVCLRNANNTIEISVLTLCHKI
ncbi:hypothetical protein CPLU01_15330 [Colletotrichum plurivorum]|uniref:Uncharacterized protein n=1 Tax=Colletotrichum plurivorum TaxID=2175906 RepID=A0A8H6MV93_9PEZI|nr:hypothetical protein CPLU01_15330 [Colletotrichum plurivorum]